MELRVLRYFLTIAQEGNISKAASVLHITQPTLSRQIQELENELGVCLFDRTKKKIQLTEDGFLFRQRAYEIITLSDKVKFEFQQQHRTLEGQIVFGCVESKGSKELAKRMAEFQRQHPHVVFSLYNSDSDEIKEKLQDGLLDIGLLLEPVDKEKYAYSSLYPIERWGVVMNKEDPLAKKAAIYPADLFNLPLILPIRQEVRQRIVHWIGKEEEDLPIVCFHRLFSNVSYMIKQKMGYCIAIDGISGLECDSELAFVPLALLEETRSVLVWKKDRPLSRPAKAFLDFFKAYPKKEVEYD